MSGRGGGIKVKRKFKTKPKKDHAMPALLQPRSRFDAPDTVNKTAHDSIENMLNTIAQPTLNVENPVPVQPEAQDSVIQRTIPIEINSVKYLNQRDVRIQMLANTLMSGHVGSPWSENPLEVANQIASLASHLKSMYSQDRFAAKARSVQARQALGRRVGRVASATHFSLISDGENDDFADQLSRLRVTDLFRGMMDQMVDRLDPDDVSSQSDDERSLPDMPELTLEPSGRPPMAFLTQPIAFEVNPFKAAESDNESIEHESRPAERALMEALNDSENSSDDNSSQLSILDMIGVDDASEIKNEVHGTLTGPGGLQINVNETHATHADDGFEHVDKSSSDHQHTFTMEGKNIKVRIYSIEELKALIRAEKELRNAEKAYATAITNPLTEHEQLIEILELFVVPGANENLDPNRLRVNDLMRYLTQNARMQDRGSVPEAYNDVIINMSDNDGRKTEVGAFISNFSSAVEEIVEVIKENGLRKIGSLNDKMIDTIIARHQRTKPANSLYTSTLTGEIIRMNKIVQCNYDPIHLHSLFKTPLSDAAKRIYGEWIKRKRSLTTNQLIKITETYYKINPRQVGVGTFLDRDLRAPFDKGPSFSSLNAMAQMMTDVRQENIDVLVQILQRKVKV
uniref:Uncharacterized protein n=1 Tax=viral metagenome TaxID=1070528 RepID=A0A2V0RC30_9ZZZZ